MKKNISFYFYSTLYFVFFLFLFSVFSYHLDSIAQAQEANISGTGGKKEKIIYKYKEYEKFDFDEMSIDASGSGPGDLTVGQREQLQFKNKLPFRKNFNPELKRSIENIK